MTGFRSPPASCTAPAPSHGTPTATPQFPAPVRLSPPRRPPRPSPLLRPAAHLQGGVVGQAQAVAVQLRRRKEERR